MSAASFAEFLPELVAARHHHGWTRAQLATEIGVAHLTVASWEQQSRVPARENAQRWADALGVQLPADTAGWFAKASMRQVPLHGTRGGASRHRAGKEPVCRACLAAEAASTAAWRARRRARS